MFTVLRPHPWISVPIGSQIAADGDDSKIAALLTDGYLAPTEPVEPVEPVEPASEPPPVE